jgi:hypothetical protein
MSPAKNPRRPTARGDLFLNRQFFVVANLVNVMLAH